jgi:hypothetical protein
MIEIILLIILSQKIGKKAALKGLKVGWWKFYTVAAWICAEILGIMIAIILFGPTNMFSIYSIAIVSAFGGYLFINYLIDKAPPVIGDDDIDQLGRNSE